MKTAIIILTLAAAAALCAQQTPTISVKVDLVPILATVHDSDGKIVKNLTPADFILKVDGVEQKITYFKQESDLPLSIGLLVDTSTSQRGVLEEERRASDKFLDQVLREDKDQAFVVSFDVRVQTLQHFTSSRTELAAALDRLKIPDQVSTLIYSAVRDSARDLMQQEKGRKAFILLTDGVAFKDPTSISDAIEFAQRADTIIYTILFSDPNESFGPIRATILKAFKARGKHGLERMARETGGAAYEVSPTQSIEEIYSLIEEALRNQYIIGFTPVGQSPDGKYHKIKLATTDPHQVVNARAGYYAK
ncbi:MAG: VWA domain-containing protein [Candidatus Acidiferrales bacterium]